MSAHKYAACVPSAPCGSPTLSEADLAKIAAAYDPAAHEAPIVVGHPTTDAPAFGWVERVEARPDGLHAIPRQVNGEFAELVRKGSYKKVSAAFYPATAANNPKPGVPYLRHVGFLGAEPPAVKGLKGIQFAEAEDIFFAEEDILALREHSISARETAYRRKGYEDAMRGYVAAGRLPIGLLSGALAFCEGLSDSQTFEFSESDGETLSFSQAEWFLDFVSKLPIPVHVGELAGGEFAEDGGGDFELPAGYVADNHSAEIDRLAKAHIKTSGGSYADAVRVVSRHLPR